MTADFSIPEDRFDNQAYLEERVSHVSGGAQGFLRSALSYLYLADGPMNLPRERLKGAESELEPRERLLVRWLYTRTNGSLRSQYGARSLVAARRARYRCERCRFADVRALHLDHVEGHTPDTAFACLCANCHNIKSRAHDWSGKRRYK